MITQQMQTSISLGETPENVVDRASEHGSSSEQQHIIEYIRSLEERILNLEHSRESVISTIFI